MLLIKTEGLLYFFFKVVKQIGPAAGLAKVEKLCKFLEASTFRLSFWKREFKPIAKATWDLLLYEEEREN